MSHGKSPRSGSSKQPPHQRTGEHGDKGLPSRPFSLPPGYYDYYGIPRPKSADVTIQAKRTGMNQGPPIPRGILEYYGIVPQAGSDSAPSSVQQKEEAQAKPEPSPADVAVALPSAESIPVQAKSDDATFKSETGWINELSSTVLDHANSAGQNALPEALRKKMEQALGVGLSDVTVVKDDPDALAMGAQAFARGNEIHFAPGMYQPESPSGQELLGHELTHVIQQRQGRVKAPAQPKGESIIVDDPSLEREADEQGARAARTPVPAPSVAKETTSTHGIATGAGSLPAAPAIQPSRLGGAAGAVAGLFTGGIPGAAAGAMLGDSLTTRSRHLTGDEIAYARTIFQKSVDYSKITITRDSMISAGAPKTIGNTIHLKTDLEHFKKDAKGEWTMDLTAQGKLSLVHEMTHVWQYQHGGFAYIPNSLISQFKAWLSSGDNNGAYQWQPQAERGVPWEQWNPEQQAECIEEYNAALRKVNSATASGRTPAAKYIALINKAQPYVDKVRRGEGAPHR